MTIFLLFLRFISVPFFMSQIFKMMLSVAVCTGDKMKTKLNSRNLAGLIYF